jgi:hypothetical protein
MTPGLTCNINGIPPQKRARYAYFDTENSSNDSVWFEPVAVYDNAKLSQAMILSGYWTSRGDVVDIGYVPPLAGGAAEG